MKRSEYKPIKGWFDLSKLKLPPHKFKIYSELQNIGQHYHETYEYQQKHNRAQLYALKELCAEMNNDIIINYGALERMEE